MVFTFVAYAAISSSDGGRKGKGKRFKGMPNPGGY
jgi:hypothetical protein